VYNSLSKGTSPTYDGLFLRTKEVYEPELNELETFGIAYVTNDEKVENSAVA
jgi:hypothetical protein